MQRNHAKWPNAVEVARSRRPTAKEFDSTVLKWFRKQQVCQQKFLREIPIPLIGSLSSTQSRIDSLTTSQPLTPSPSPRSGARGADRIGTPIVNPMNYRPQRNPLPRGDGTVIRTTLLLFAALFAIAGPSVAVAQDRRSIIATFRSSTTCKSRRRKRAYW